jgi:hypothetical protein
MLQYLPPFCVPLFVRVRLLTGASQETKRSWPVAFHFKFSDLDDRIYPIELEIKDTTDTAKSASYHEVHFEIDSEWQLRTKFTKKEIISIFTL